MQQYDNKLDINNAYQNAIPLEDMNPIKMKKEKEKQNIKSWHSYSNHDLNPTFVQHMRGLLAKRFNNNKRDKRVWCCQLAIPVMFIHKPLCLHLIYLSTVVHIISWNGINSNWFRILESKFTNFRSIV